MTKAQKQEQAEAIERLRGWLKPGMTLYCTLRSVSRSGMTRCIALHWFEAREDGREPDMMRATTNAAKALGWRYDGKRDGIIVNGCGMDMGVHLVYELSHLLFGQGWTCPGKRCGSSDHHTRYMGNDQYEKGKPYRKGLKHNGGTAGYALAHRWV